MSSVMATSAGSPLARGAGHVLCVQVRGIPVAARVLGTGVAAAVVVVMAEIPGRAGFYWLATASAGSEAGGDQGLELPPPSLMLPAVTTQARRLRSTLPLHARCPPFHVIGQSTRARTHRPRSPRAPGHPARGAARARRAGDRLAGRALERRRVRAGRAVAAGRSGVRRVASRRSLSSRSRQSRPRPAA